MPRNEKPRIAILGAGPVGLEAALYARQLHLPFVVYERGQVGEHLLRWGHVRLFSPFGMNTTLLGRGVGRAAGSLPTDDALLTGWEHVEQYLSPLADFLRDDLRPETEVLHVGRRGFFKSEAPGDAARARQPFLLLVRDQAGERVEEADVVLDCTGTYSQPRWLGSGGIPAVGELAAQDHIAYGLEDILGARKEHYANRSVLVIGSGYSAATTVSLLARLAEEQHATWITWLARSPHSQPLRRITGDPLRERDRLAVRANTLATRSDGNVEFHPGTVVDAVELLGADGGFRVTCRTAGKPRVWEVDRVIANVGYTPDAEITRELQVHECYASLGPMKLAATLLGQKGQDCLKQTAAGPDVLRNPEPNFFVLGAKSYGRNSQFLLRLGFEQVRDVFTLITGTSGLDLYRKP
jgi:thioredoxin reductase